MESVSRADRDEWSAPFAWQKRLRPPTMWIGVPAWQTHLLLNLPFLGFYAISAFAKPRYLQWLAAADALGLAVLYMLVFPPMGAG